MHKFFTSSSGSSMDWLILIATIFFIGFILATSITWFTIFRKKGKKKRKSHNGRRRKNNPSLAETGGLPPIRDEKKSTGQTPPL